MKECIGGLEGEVNLRGVKSEISGLSRGRTVGEGWVIKERLKKN